MNVTLYNVSTDRRGINKNLAGGITFIGCQLKHNTSIVNPTFILTKPLSEGDLANFNYVDCPVLKRKYFIKDIRIIPGNMVEVECHVDVLESFKSQFLERECYIERCEIQYNDKNSAMSVFFDSEYPIRSDVNISTITLKNNGVPGSASSGTGYFVTVNGGVQ